MKINLGNADYFDGKNIFSLRRKIKKGMAILSTAAVMGGSLAGCGYHSLGDNTSNMVSKEISASVSKERINEMNLILNDKDCSDTFFDEVCTKLEEDGISFERTKDGNDISTDNDVIVTLDQQYSSGSDTIIFAPHNNARLGNSDSLALAMQAAFQQNGFLGNKIACGKIGYREDENGNVSRSIPTDTEEALENDSDISFVTISFGTQNINSQWVAKSIENGLARQIYYLDNYDSDTDLIYRASLDDSVEVIADYFNSDVSSLNNFNGINGHVAVDSQAIINPNVGNMDVFNSNSQFSIDEVKTRAY